MNDNKVGQNGQGNGNAPELMQSLKAKFMVTRIIHLALLAGSMLFGSVALVITFKQLNAAMGPHPVLIVADFLCFATIAGSVVVRKSMLKRGAAPTDPDSALVKYQTICLVQWAMIEGGALFAAVAMLVSRNIFAFALFLISIAFLAFRRPSEQEFMGMFGKRR